MRENLRPGLPLAWHHLPLPSTFVLHFNYRAFGMSNGRLAGSLHFNCRSHLTGTDVSPLIAASNSATSGIALKLPSKQNGILQLTWVPTGLGTLIPWNPSRQFDACCSFRRRGSAISGHPQSNPPAKEPIMPARGCSTPGLNPAGNHRQFPSALWRPQIQSRRWHRRVRPRRSHHGGDREGTEKGPRRDREGTESNATESVIAPVLTQATRGGAWGSQRPLLRKHRGQGRPSPIRPRFKRLHPETRASTERLNPGPP